MRFACAAGGLTPAQSRMVGAASTQLTIAWLTTPRFFCPGADTITGSRRPASSRVLFTQDVSFGASMDPNASVHPNATGARTVELVFHVHQNPACGGFSELRLFA